jgi:methylenetetrahydrofolate--tRNA-(uracil-5-)-methyltransferase
MNTELTIIGGGLAGCEAAFQAAERGIDVLLYEMRPESTTPAHKTDKLAELVCSNSLGSLLPDRASGLLMDELSRCNSLLLKVARISAVPSGSSLSVDREAFSKGIEEALKNHPRITTIRKESNKFQMDGNYRVWPVDFTRLASSIANFTGKDKSFLL